MKKIFSFGLMAALVCGISMSVASCKDDNDSKSEEQQAEEQKAQATKALKFYDVVSHLADLSEMNDSTYESQTFEPVVGEEDAGDPQTRIVATNDLETAAMRFADIVGLTVGSGFPASTPSYTWSDPDVGTLTWTRSTDGTSWATVDVDIKQVPHLTKIVYKHPDQMGENASFSGTAYYRFGDVIRRNNTSKNGTQCTEYWICVRPAFGKEGKGDSHWISVGELPEDNMFHHSGSNGTEYYVPQKLCTDNENMQNFAEMLFAIFNPVEWKRNLTEEGWIHPKMFWDFKVANIDYHNEYFWQNVYNGWKDKNIAQEAFNMNSLEELKTVINRDGLNLLYKGYSWWTTFSWNCELNTISFTNGAGAESNFHKKKTETLEKDMKEIRFDCHKMGKDQRNYTAFFGNEIHRWTVRYATGKQLMSRGTFNKFEGIVGCEDVWNYNRTHGPTRELSNTPPEITPQPENALETPVVGSFIGKDGKYYPSEAGARNKGGGAVAMVVYYDKTQQVDSKMGYHGLAIALEDVTDKAEWGHKADLRTCLTDDDAVCAPDRNNTLPEKLNGIIATQQLAQGTCGSARHPAAKACYDLAKPIDRDGFSAWFLPSAGQWIKAFTGMGMTYNAADATFSNGGRTTSDIIGQYMKAGGCTPLNGYYWSSTETGSNYAWSFKVPTGNDAVEVRYDSKDYQWRVRPFLAFDKSGQGDNDYGVDKAQAKVGYILATNGKFYKDRTDLMRSNKTAAAIVVVANAGAVESGDEYRNYSGLALAINASAQGYAWGGGNKRCCANYAGCDMGGEDAANHGLKITKYLQGATCPDCGQAHPAFQAAKNFQPAINADGFSQWFIPNTAQYIDMLKSFGAEVRYEREQYVEESSTSWMRNNAMILHIDFTNDNYEKMKRTFINAGAEWAGKSYWTSSFFDYASYTDRAWKLVIIQEWGNVNRDPSDHAAVLVQQGSSRSSEIAIRPMVAF